MLALTACPVCGGERAEAVDLGAGEHRRCGDCATTYTARYADPEDVFVDGYFTDASRFGIDVRHPRFQAYLVSVAHRRAAFLERATAGPGTLLDVGCGTGEFSAVAAQRGWRVQGVELMAQAAEHARTVHALDVRVTSLQDAELPERAYDAVSALHVAEHVPDVAGFLREMARRARPGGHLLVEVPNLDSRQRAATGARWTGLRPAEHLTQFTPATLRRALIAAGLEPRLVRTPTWIWRVQTLREALADLGRPSWEPRLSRLPGAVAWALLHAVAAADARLGRGQVVLAIARVR
ncbi:MAG TPA: class I SAM-dependent methyltransferase [Solirubrobacteraceae bacterium]|jgi:SAM-dependent methyltransferase